MSKQSLVSLDSLLELINKKKVELILPRQVLDEFQRDKFIVAKEFAENLKNLSKAEIKVPIFFKNYQKVKDLKKYSKKIQSTNKKILEEYNKRIINPRSKINSKIKKIFSLAAKVNEDSYIIEKAYYRTLKGNPPRKNNKSFGDAIIWETILDKLIDENLKIISGDSDFSSDINKEQLNEFLEYEWSEKSKKNIELFTNLGDFINTFTKKRTVKKEIIEEERVISNHPITLNKKAGDFVFTRTPLGQESVNFINIDNPQTCNICGEKYETGINTGAILGCCVDCQNTNGSVVTGNFSKELSGGVSLSKTCSKCGNLYFDSELSLTLTSEDLCNNCKNTINIQGF